MIDCNNVENFFREYKKMCQSISCENCKLPSSGRSAYINCSVYIENFPKEAIAVVQSWSDEHPQKTFLSDFLEKYPKAPLNLDGTPHVCPNAFGYCGNDGCYGTCKDCWNRPLTEDNE